MYMMTPGDALQIAHKFANEAECRAMKLFDSSEKDDIERDYKSILTATKVSELYMKLYRAFVEDRKRIASVR